MRTLTLVLLCTATPRKNGGRLVVGFRYKRTRGKITFFPLFAFEGIPFFFIRGGAPNPALLFSLQKSKQKASTPRSHKIYFYPGILQLPTVGQVKCLYNSVKNKFYRRLQRGALNGNGKQQRQNGKNKRKKHKNTHCLLNRLVRER